jgi:hypothetical protein
VKNQGFVVTAVVACVAVSLTACSESSGTTATPKSSTVTASATTSSISPTSTTTSTTTTATTGTATLFQTCPKVEAALPREMVPTPAEDMKASQDIQALWVAGDLETRNALQDLSPSLARRSAAEPEGGTKYLDAEGAVLTAVTKLAERCKAVGSSALR